MKRRALVAVAGPVTSNDERLVLLGAEKRGKGKYRF